MAKKEKDFQMEFKRSFDSYLKETYQDGVYRKIPDLGFQNPFDCWTLHSGNYIAWELKRNTAKGTFNFKTFFSKREHELYALNRVIQAGGRSGVLINHYEKGKRNHAYLVHTKDAIRWHATGKSIKLEELKAFGVQVPRVTGGWDLKVAINFLLK